jgi:hypothetical protein
MISGSCDNPRTRAAQSVKSAGDGVKHPPGKIIHHKIFGVFAENLNN